MTSLVNKRNRAYERQGGICYYCGLPMWEKEDAEVLAAYLGIKARHVSWLKCTAEHLNARTDGGTDSAANVVAACLYCNSRRHLHRQDHAPSPENYRARVSACMATGHWHPTQIALESWAPR